MFRAFLPFLLLATAASSQTIIDADHADIRYTGRVDFTDVKHPRFDWPGVQVAARFQGTSVQVTLDRGGSELDVLVDGDSAAHISGGSGTQTYMAAQALRDSLHELLIIKRNEGPAVTFSGLVLDSGKGLVPMGPRPAYRIEFIGDSYTACYGCVSRVTSCADVGAATDARYAYAAVSAHDVGAEYSLLAISGRGLLHNAGDASVVSANNMQTVFGRTLRESASPSWDFGAWVPHIVVIALGINDLADTAAAITQELFTTHYRQFIGNIQSVYPSTDVLCLAFNWPDTLDAYVRSAYEEELGAGNGNVHFLHVTAGNAGGCDFHPNVGGHRAMAQQLTPVLAGILGSVAAAPSPAQAKRGGRHAPLLLIAGRQRAVPGAVFLDIRGRVVRASPATSAGVTVKVAE